MSNYTFEGPKWATTTVTWSFASQAFANDGASFSHSIGTQLQSTIAAAFNEWAAVSGLTLVNAPDSPSVDIRIGFGYLGFATTHIVGVTTYAVGASLRPDVIVRLEDPSETPLTLSGGSYMYAGTLSTVYQVALHEIGHALGLGHSTDFFAAMYPTSLPQNQHLDSSDIAGIQTLYPTTPVTAGTKISLHGNHTGYLVSYDPATGTTYARDAVAGRDGTQTATHVRTLVFSDGIGRIDSTGNTEEVARLYRAAFGRSPDATGLDNNAAPINAGTLNLAGVANAFINAPEFSGRYGALADTDFVRQLYQNVLGRSGTGQEVQGWTNQLGGGMSRAAVLVGFSDSYEDKVNTLSYIGDKDYSEAYRLYQAAFNRTPDALGLKGWTTSLDGGMSLNQAAQGFVDSAEFARSHTGLTDATFVGGLYQNVLHRTGSSSEVTGWVDQLSHGMSRAGVLLGFSDGSENRIATAGATHDGWVYLTT